MSQPTPAHNEPILRLENVSFGSMRDPDRAVGENINWAVNRGDFWVLAGLHGAGKSDLLMLLGGLMPPLRGNYWFLGEPMPIFEEARLAVRLKLGLVFETGQLFNHLTVRENLALPLNYHRNPLPEDAERTLESLLDELELGPWANTTPGAIGRSIQKRVGLGRALILNPELLLLDNPLGGLDPQQIHWWLGFLQRIGTGHPLMGNKPVTLIATASDLRPWRARARQCAVLRGRSLQVVDNWNAGEPLGTSIVGELLPET